MKKILLILAAGCLAGGCGYTTRGTLLSGTQKINIAVFENKTYEYQLETSLANEITDQFIIDGELQVVNPQDADIRLTGTIVEYKREPLVYDQNDNVSQYKIIIYADAVLTDLKNEAVIWQGSRISGEDIYFVTGNLSNSEEDARQKAFKDLAENLVNAVIEGW